MPDSALKAYEQKLSVYRAHIDGFIDAHLPRPGALAGVETLHEAMRYAVNGGKRIRPALVLASCEAVGSDCAQALPTACAIELIHAYSLVHDDLPAMDDDAERRGKPSVHNQFDEATAILAGDALLSLGFEWMAAVQPPLVGAEQTLHAMAKIGYALGSFGMVGGQQLDLAQHFTSSASLLQMQDLKTGALLSVSAEAGAILGGGTQSEIELLALYGLRLGQTYQLVDDLLDEQQDQNRNASMLDFESKQDVQQSAQTLNEAALNCLEPFGERAMWLKSLAKSLLFRNN